MRMADGTQSTEREKEPVGSWEVTMLPSFTAAVDFTLEIRRSTQRLTSYWQNFERYAPSFYNSKSEQYLGVMASSILYMKRIGVHQFPRYRFGLAPLHTSEVHIPGNERSPRSSCFNMPSESELAEVVQLGQEM